MFPLLYHKSDRYEKNQITHLLSDLTLIIEHIADMLHILLQPSDHKE